VSDNGNEKTNAWLHAETRSASGGWPAVGPVRVPGLTVLFHPDPERIGDRVALTALAAGREELLARGEPGFAPPGRAGPRPLADVHLSRRPLRLEPGSAPGSVRLLRGDSGTSLAVDGVPVEDEREIAAAEVERGAVLLLASSVVLLLSPVDPIAATDVPHLGLVGESPAMVQLRREIRRGAGLDVPVLVRGETGTGKELVARALHRASPRAQGPWLAVNLAAVPPALAVAELFGAARGAFTGADVARDGFFRRAHGGTLLLDEIGEVPPEVQVLLLRALESGEIQGVGGGEPRRVDVRLVAATDADLEAAVAAGRFRAPLLHRLSACEIRVPPLAERREDFGRLLLHFLRAERQRLGEPEPGSQGPPPLPAPLVARLAAFDWPGNVRQLQNAARRLVLAARDPEGEKGLWRVMERLLQESARAAAPPDRADTLPPPGGEPPAAPRRYRDPESVSEEELHEALRACRWRIQAAAGRLGVSRGALYDRIDRSPGIRKAADLGADEIAAALERCGGNLDAAVEELQVSRRGLRRRMSRLGREIGRDG
jgi:two-component system, NtrC family, nitrogen regulation response regulator GlnG